MRQRSLSKKLLILLAASACTALVACSASEAPEPNTGDSPDDNQVTESFDGKTLSITQTAVPALTNLHVILAPENSAQFDLEIEEIVTTGASEYITGLAKGDIIAVPGTPSIAFTARDRDIDVVIIGGGAMKTTGIVVSNDLNVGEGDWAALKQAVDEAHDAGQPLAFGGAVAASTNYVMCHTALEDNGIDVDNKLQVIDIPGFTEHPAALERGELDILCTPEPFVTLSLQSGAGTYFGAPFDTDAGEILGALMTTRQNLEDPETREAVKRWLQTVSNVVDDLNSTDRATEWVTTTLNVTPEVAADMVSRSSWDMSISVDELSALAAQAYGLGQTDQDWSQNVNEYVDLSLLEELGITG